MCGEALGRGHQRLEGAGWAFGALLQPGVARLLVSGPMRRLIGGFVPIDELRVTDAATLVAAVRASVAAGDDDAALSSFKALIAGPTPRDRPRHPPRATRGRARRAGSLDPPRRGPRGRERIFSLRSLQRLVREQLGLTPKWLIRRYRMQEAAALLAGPTLPPLAELAASLGFSDQAHLSREFRAVIGETPRRYALAARASR